MDILFLETPFDDATSPGSGEFENAPDISFPFLGDITYSESQTIRSAEMAAIGEIFAKEVGEEML